ncbi:hypothetical protein RCH33_1167 [Flavobacterium daejeonense]|nr:hypothetical protein RCH33_1167 [Flavobacterium daejeonense]
MFLNYLKEFSVKKRLKNSLLNVKRSSSLGDIKTVGVIVDQSHFANTKSLLDELKANGILKENVSLLLFKGDKNVDFEVETVKLTSGNLDWKGQIKSEEVKKFIARDFDLLVSYYEVEKAILLVVTHESGAKFKVGFANIDKRLNDFMINTNQGNYQVFVQELFRYLKILNKI